MTMLSNSAAGHSRSATMIGTTAVLCWALLAPLAVAAGAIPPFQLLSMTTGLAFGAGMALLALLGRGLEAFRQPPSAWLLAITAIFLYHALYFYAVSTIPPAHASLVAYLWPLLIVILAGVTTASGGLSWRHLGGAALGFAGVANLMLGEGEAQFGYPVSGYLAAGCCALIWSGYSVLNRRFARVPSEMLIGVCGVVSLLAAIAHVIASETTVAPTATQSGVVLALGLGPVGLAFVAWDHGTKHGHLALLGTLAYFTPILSTLALVVCGMAAATGSLAFAALAVVAGAVVAGLSRGSR